MNVLFIAPRFPFPLRKGDQLTVYRRLVAASKKHCITLLTFAPKREQEQVGLKKIAPYCKGGVITVKFKLYEGLYRVLKAFLFGKMPLQTALYESRLLHESLRNLLLTQKIDIVHFFLLRMDAYRIDTKGVPCVIDLIDSMTLNISRRIKFEKGWKRWGLRKELARVRRLEQHLHLNYNSMILCAEADKKFVPGKQVVLIPSTVFTDEFYPIHVEKIPKSIIFSGNMGYAPNQHAVRFFLEKVFPCLNKKDRSIVFLIAGCNPPENLLVEAEKYDNVKILGAVASMPETLNKAVISVAPMQSGSGMQGKILEAMACGLPVIATSIGKGSIEADEEDGLIVFDRPREMAEGILALIHDEERCNVLGERARQYIVSHHSNERSESIIDDIYMKLLEK